MLTYDNHLILDTKLGSLTICEKDQTIVCVKWHYDLPPTNYSGSRLLEKTAKEILEYLDGKRHHFDIPTTFIKGTPFQINVWKALTHIPYGETVSYSQLANRLNNPHAARAIGRANHENPLCLLIPCHRVIGQNGSLTGYAGGLNIKQKLLELEKQYYRIQMKLH